MSFLLSTPNPDRGGAEESIFYEFLALPPISFATTLRPVRTVVGPPWYLSGSYFPNGYGMLRWPPFPA
jgi:hypothetical protein